MNRTQPAWASDWYVEDGVLVIWLDPAAECFTIDYLTARAKDYHHGDVVLILGGNT